MDGDQGMRRLEDAIEAFLARDPSASDAELLAANPEVADLLRPMVAEPGAGEVAGGGPGPLRRLGELELRREIGRGGMGVVYEAEDLRLKRRVAVKVLPRSADTSASSIVRFRREAELAGGLRHPAVVPVYALGETDSELYLVMELEYAASLADVLGELVGECAADLGSGAFTTAALAALRRKFPEHVTSATPPPRAYVEAVVAAVAQVADGLGLAHAQGVLHRDVKPANILIGADGGAFLTDFGLACVQGEPGVTQPGTMPGTPHCMAPEQASADRGALGPPTDVFALGATLYEALTLSRAFPGDTLPTVLFAVVHKAPPPADELNPSLPRDLVAIVHKALEKEPARRYATAKELAADLTAFLRGEPVVARAVPRLERVRRRIQREPWRAAAVALALLGGPALVAAGALALRRDDTTATGERVQRAEWIDRLLADGFREAGEGDLQAARRHFLAVLERAPDAEEGVAGLSVAARRRGDLGALTVLQDRPEALRQSPALRRRAAMLLQALGRDPEAQALLVGLDAQPVGFDAFLAGFGCIEAGHRGDRSQYAEARRLLHRAVVTSDHARPAFYHEWLHAAAHSRDADGIEAAIAALQRLWPGAPESWYWIGFARAELGDVPAALAALAKAIALAPDFVAARLNEARLLRHQNRLVESRDKLQQLAAAAPEVAALHREIGTTLGMLGDHQGAVVRLQQAISLLPEDPLVRRDYAAALLAAGRAKEATVEVQRVLTELPEDATTRRLFGAALAASGRHREACEQYEAVLATAADADAWFSLAMSRAALGEGPRAREAYEQALALDDRHVRSMVNLAIIEVRSGAAAAAVERLQKALAIDPTFVPARRTLLRALDADPAAAVAMCRDWVASSPELAEAWRHLAWSMVRSASVALRTEALAAARKADAMTGGADAPTRHVLAEALLWHGDAATALSMVQQSMATLDPADRFTPYYRELMQATEAKCKAALAPGVEGKR